MSEDVTKQLKVGIILISGMKKCVLREARFDKFWIHKKKNN